MQNLPFILKRFYSLPGQQKRWLFSAYVAFAKWDLCIRFLPYKWWRDRVFWRAGSKNKAAASNLSTFIDIVEKAGRHHWAKMNCLRRCLVTQELLYKQGVCSDLCIGVRKSMKNNELEAHSWLEINKTPINDSEDVINTYSKLNVSDTSSHVDLLLKRRSRR